MVVLAEGETSLKEYYGMPDGEIPFNVYEDRKVRELSERINSRQSAVKYSNVHIISGRKQEQVRRIAYLTALKLLNAGAEVVPVADVDNLGDDGAKSSKYRVFLLDEGEVRSNLPEGETFDPEHVIRVMQYIRRHYTKNHAIFLSLSQETYDSRFKDGIEGGAGLDLSVAERAERKDEPPAAQKKRKTYWYAFLLPALSFLISPFNQYFQVHGNTFSYGSVWSSLYLNGLYPFLFFAPIALTLAGIVVLVLLARQSGKKHGGTLILGLSLLIVQIAVPIALFYLWANVNAGQVVHSSIIGYYTIPLLLFEAFQLAAAVSFLLLPLSVSSRGQRALLVASFGISVIFLLGVYLSVSSNLPSLAYTVPTQVILPNRPIFPMEVPYNTLYFGFAYNTLSSYVTPLLRYTGFASQALFGTVYLYVSLSQRKSGSSFKLKDDSPEPHSA